MGEPRWLTPEQLHTWRGYRRMSLLLGLAVSRDLHRDSGLSDADYDVLSSLSEPGSGEVRLHALAARMAWSASRLSHHVARMEARGLVTRVRTAGAGREVFLRLTAEGRSVLEAAAPLHVASVRRHLVDLLTDEEVEVLGRIAGKVAGRLEQPEPD